MSIGKIADASNFGDDFKDLSLEQIKEKLKAKFYTAYGRYSNVSGKMWLELYHNGGDDHTKGSVVWRRGTVGKAELDEDEILDREVAIPRFMELMRKGFSLEFNGVTKEDIEKYNALRITSQSNAQREGWLGIYYKGKSFFKVNEYSKGQFYIERGYDGITSESSIESEGGARFELDDALDKGFRREDENEGEYVNPLEAFGCELDNTLEAIEHKRKTTIENGQLPDALLEMMSN